MSIFEMFLPNFMLHINLMKMDRVFVLPQIKLIFQAPQHSWLE